MTPFEDFSFFIYLLIPIVPAVLLGILGVSGKVRAAWVLLSTLGMLLLIGRPLSVLYQIAGYLLFQWIIVRLYLSYRLSALGKNRAGVFYLVTFLAILPLVVVKINPSFIALGFWQTVIGFIGISYLTFRTAGIIIEIRDGLIKEVRLVDFISFVLFFPTIASGPIDRYRRFVTDLYKPLTRQDYGELAIQGMDYIFRGFLYKFIIAYLINKYWLEPLNHTFGFLPTLKYMYVYGFYLFFNFAGYSAFAIGVSYLMGIKTPINFDKPFMSKNIKDFWNRWHISLSFWFRDYIYMRFVLDSAKKKRFKNRYTASYVGYLFLFGIMGVWHGTQLQYVLYGLYHAGLMIGFDFLDRKNKTWKYWGTGPIWDLSAILVTFHFVMFGFLIFSGRLV
ncbi:D-alanyl-lipoteichoic acid biosynthesis protein DltB [Desulfosporosinus nitroreducens]|uniref:Teichoic acid D-alanyltransferase n=1 Tax=Desulfosporosinus nitroreducens TaxID=2018668 RepID=A0ABT8QLL4_9FIRM|nr:D-alanyl-lipoteichoic acid biosynthesis protein DltB [Desulfosporosinus nitroreducens]MDO0822233.1 D-alanyl-lipoteichoic acid biosynthesis protein DltB [Desulfosporosinus nitroreducens]